MIDLTDYYCAFSHRNGARLRYFRLSKNGSIVDIDTDGHDNERYWEIKDDKLLLYNNRSIRTSIFEFDDRATKYYDSIYNVLYGLYKGEIPLKIIAVKNKEDVFLSRTRYICWDMIKREILKVGNNTKGKITIKGNENIASIDIGDYTTIGNNVSIIFENDTKCNISTYNFDEETVKDNTDETRTNSPTEDNEKRLIVIGNDVYISDNVQIFPNTVIGDGAVILPNSSVQGNIPSYSINSGEPCITTAYRYEKEIIEKLLEVKWWNWERKVIEENVELLSSNRISEFLDKYKSR